MARRRGAAAGGRANLIPGDRSLPLPLGCQSLCLRSGVQAVAGRSATAVTRAWLVVAVQQQK